MSRQIHCTSATRRGRMRKAEQFFLAAETIAEILGQHDDSDISDAYVTLCVHAGVAVSDVACCKRLGVHSKGQDHAAAIGLLSQVDRKAGEQLGVLLDMKEKAGYSARPVSGTDRKKAVRAATALVELARDLQRSSCQGLLLHLNAITRGSSLRLSLYPPAVLILGVVASHPLHVPASTTSSESPRNLPPIVRDDRLGLSETAGSNRPRWLPALGGPGP
jgi:hypothetical protein